MKTQSEVRHPSSVLRPLFRIILHLFLVTYFVFALRAADNYRDINTRGTGNNPGPVILRSSDNNGVHTLVVICVTPTATATYTPTPTASSTNTP